MTHPVLGDADTRDEASRVQISPLFPREDRFIERAARAKGVGAENRPTSKSLDPVTTYDVTPE
jgi:hypothetical protein